MSSLIYVPGPIGLLPFLQWLNAFHRKDRYGCGLRPPYSLCSLPSSNCGGRFPLLSHPAPYLLWVPSGRPWGRGAEGSCLVCAAPRGCVLSHQPTRALCDSSVIFAGSFLLTCMMALSSSFALLQVRQCSRPVCL